MKGVRHPGIISLITLATLGASEYAACMDISKSKEEKTGRRALTVADAIETTRAMIDRAGNAIFLSPDHRRYAVMLITGDVERNGLRARLLVGSLNSLDEARPSTVAELFTTALGRSWKHGSISNPTALTQPHANPPIWIDNHKIAFLWEDERLVSQVISVDTRTRELTYLTTSRTDVTGFAIDPRSGTVIYDARFAHTTGRSKQMLHDGFSVVAPDAATLLSGIVDGTSIHDFRTCERFIIDAAGSPARKILGLEPAPCEVSFLSSTSKHRSSVLSTDGKWAVLNAPVGEIPASWSRYSAPAVASWIKNDHNMGEPSRKRSIQQLFIIDVHRGVTHALWGAPFEPFARTSVVWASNASSLLLIDTLLPVREGSETTFASRGSVEVDVRRGTFRILAERFDLGSARERAVTLADGTSVRLRNDDAHWYRGAVPAADGGAMFSHAPPTMTVWLRQGLNAPPALYAKEIGTANARLLLDLNPQLARLTVGHVEFIHWKDRNGREWKGRLYNPTNWNPSQRYPLVIQTHGYAAEDEFSIYGQGGASIGLGPGWSVYLAQLLANRGIFVLQIGEPIDGFGLPDGPAQFEAGKDGIERAVEYLSEKNLVDRQKVGLMGHSGTGRFVEYVISHPSDELHYSAAIVADHADANYVQASLYGWPAFSLGVNGSPPFGRGLHDWLSHSPAFRVEEITTPLQLQVTDRGLGFETLLWGWEMFTRLRHQEKPVEYYVVPDIQHGSHLLQNPRQLLQLQERALSWWSFWLNEEEIEGPDKNHQYAIWRALRKQYERTKFLSGLSGR